MNVSNVTVFYFYTSFLMKSLRSLMLSVMLAGSMAEKHGIRWVDNTPHVTTMRMVNSAHSEFVRQPAGLLQCANLRSPLLCFAPPIRFHPAYLQ